MRAAYTNNRQINATHANLTTKAINITFSVTGNVRCKAYYSPSGTVLQEDIQDEQIVVRDLNLTGCGGVNGSMLYADVWLWRGVKNPSNGGWSNVYVTGWQRYLVGSYGCGTGCLRCNGEMCLLCTDPSTSLFNGTCVPSCPSSHPYSQSFSMTYLFRPYTSRRCLSSCPEANFPSPMTGQCTPCV